jgi:dihydroorotate dehydrogenase (NAD+) catalytic subunit
MRGKTFQEYILLLLMDLTTKIGDITLRNPMILASGVLGTSYSTMKRMYEAGLGAVITKSIGVHPKSGNPNPSVFALNEIRSIVNSVGLANPGYKIFREDVEILIENSVPTIVSVFGENKEEFSEVIDGLKDLPIQAFELNLSCPNTERGGIQIGVASDLVYDIVQELKKRTEKPLWVKLTPNVSDIIEIASAAIKGGCNALVAINTLKAMVIDIQTKVPVLGFKKGGLSGAAIKPVGIRYVYDLYEQFGNEIPIIGVGGIFRGEDIIEYILAGATAVEIGSSLGVAYPENMVRFFQMKVQKYLTKNKINSINEIIGGAHS